VIIPPIKTPKMNTMFHTSFFSRLEEPNIRRKARIANVTKVCRDAEMSVTHDSGVMEPIVRSMVRLHTMAMVL